MKANATGGGGKKPAAKNITRTGKVVTKKTTKKPSVYGKSVPTTSVGGGRVKYPTKKSAAAARSLVGNAALMAVPGGAAVKGVQAAAKLAAQSRGVGVKVGYNLVRASSAAKKADKISLKAMSGNKAAKNAKSKIKKLDDKYMKYMEKAWNAKLK